MEHGVGWVLLRGALKCRTHCTVLTVFAYRVVPADLEPGRKGSRARRAAEGPELSVSAVEGVTGRGVQFRQSSVVCEAVRVSGQAPDLAGRDWEAVPGSWGWRIAE